jgi:hypothetical protein
MAVSIAKADLMRRMPLDGSASFNALLDIESYKSIWMFLEWTADASATDSIAFRFSVDPDTQIAFPVPVDETAALGNYSPQYASTQALAANAFTVPTTAGSYFAYFNDPPPYIQLIYTRAGGSRKFLWSVFGRTV